MKSNLIDYLYGIGRKNSVSLLISGSVFAQLITIATLPLITRLYEPGEIGAITVFVTFVGICSAFTSLRYDSAFSISTDKNEIENLLAVSLIATVLMSVLSAAVMSAFIYFGVFGLGVLPVWSGFISLPVICGLGITSVFRVLRVREGEFSILAAVGVVRNSLNVATRIAGGLLGGGLLALIAAELISALALMRHLGGPNIGKKMADAFKKDILSLIGTAKKWKRFPIYECPSVFLDQLAAAIPLFIMAGRFGATAAGLFALAYRISNLPNYHIGAAFSEVFRSRFSASVRAGNSREARQLFHSYFLKLSVTSVLISAPVAVVLPHLIGVLFGDKWQSAGELVPWVTFWAATSLVVSALSPVLSILQKQNLKLVYDIAAISAMVITFYAVEGADFVSQVRALSLANVAANMWYFIIIYTPIRRL